MATDIAKGLFGRDLAFADDPHVGDYQGTFDESRILMSILRLSVSLWVLDRQEHIYHYALLLSVKSSSVCGLQ